MNVTIEEVMHANPLTVQRHHMVSHARALMIKHKISALPVVDSENEAVGMVTATDLLSHDRDGAPVTAMMSEPVLTVPLYSQPHVAARVMRNHHIHHVVVTDSQKVVGMVSAYDLLKLTEDHRFVAKAAPSKSKKAKSRS